MFGVVNKKTGLLTKLGTRLFQLIKRAKVLATMDKLPRVKGLPIGDPEQTIPLRNLEVDRFSFHKFDPNHFALQGCGPSIAACVTGANPFEVRAWFKAWALKHDKKQVVNGVQLKGVDEKAMAEYFKGFGIDMVPITLADLQEQGFALTDRHVLLELVWWPGTAGLSWVIYHQGIFYHLLAGQETTPVLLMNLVVEAKFLLWHPDWKIPNKGNLEFQPATSS